MLVRVEWLALFKIGDATGGLARQTNFDRAW